MLFEKVTKQHILHAIEDFKIKGIPNGYGPSSTYDLIYKDKPN
jgi:5-methylcytosine-specific restriction protein B